MFCASASANARPSAPLATRARDTCGRSTRRARSKLNKEASNCRCVGPWQALTHPCAQRSAAHLWVMTANAEVKLKTGFRSVLKSWRGDGGGVGSAGDNGHLSIWER